MQKGPNMLTPRLQQLLQNVEDAQAALACEIAKEFPVGTRVLVDEGCRMIPGKVTAHKPDGDVVLKHPLSGRHFRRSFKQLVKR